MKIHTIDTGFFKLDGGAMFGVVPKSMWQKLNPPDDNNMCTWAMRCLLIESGNRLILVDNGIGNKQDDKFLSHYYLHGDATLVKSLNQLGYSPNDVTDMFLTHLHFDHCGGGVVWNMDKTGFEMMFPNATYWTNKNHWQWATQPNAREKASFLKDNLMPMQESGHLSFLDDKNIGVDGFSNLTMNGHTDAMMLPKIRYKEHTLVYCADLLPSVAHLPIPYVMGYDTRPLLTLEEKTKFLEEAFNNNYILLFEHDPLVECCTLTKTDKGIRAEKTFKLSEL